MIKKISKDESIHITLSEKFVKPTFGELRLCVKYVMTHVKYSRVNKYIVECRISGLDSASPELITESAEFMGIIETDSNDETLTNDAAEILFEDNFS